MIYGAQKQLDNWIIFKELRAVKGLIKRSYCGFAQIVRLHLDANKAPQLRVTCLAQPLSEGKMEVYQKLTSSLTLTRPSNHAIYTTDAYYQSKS